jgi:hypothetical protein
MPLAWMTRANTEAARAELPSMEWIAVDAKIEFLDTYNSAWNRHELVDDGSVLWIRTW